MELVFDEVDKNFTLALDLKHTWMASTWLDFVPPESQNLYKKKSMHAKPVLKQKW